MSKRFPSMSQIWPVFGAMTFVVYGHAIYRLFWYIPSWLNYLSIWDILVIGAYMVVLALFESLVVLAMLVILAFILPGRIFRDRFVTQASITVWVGMVWALVMHEKLLQYTGAWNFSEFALYMLAGLALFVLSVGIVSYVLIYRFKSLERIVIAVADRMFIFLYLYVPLSVLAFIIILWRNIF